MDGVNHYVLICGGRDFHNHDQMVEVMMLLLNLYGGDLRIIHGGAAGADEMAGMLAEELGIPCKVYPADWAKHGKAAGPIRNNQMLDRLEHWRDAYGHSVQVIAFPGGRGTEHCASEAERRGLSVDRLPSVGSGDRRQ